MKKSVSWIIKTGVLALLLTSVVTFSLFTVSYAESIHAPSASLYKDTSDYKETYTEPNQIGNVYSLYLVSTQKGLDLSSTKTITNKLWWKYRFKVWGKRWDSELSDEFKSKNIEKAYSEPSAGIDKDPKALNKVCASIYKKTTSDINLNLPPEHNKHKLEKDLWEFCSVLNRKPIMANQGRLKKEISKESVVKDRENLLVSVFANENYWYWKLKNDWFFSITIDTDGAFKTFQQEQLALEDKNNELRIPLEKECRRHYGSPWEKKATEEEVIRFCGLEIKN